MSDDHRLMIVAALSALPKMTVSRLRVLVDAGDAERTLAAIRGTAPASGALQRVLSDSDLAALWRAHVEQTPIDHVWRRCRQLGVSVLTVQCAEYPEALRADEAAPAVLYAAGRLDLLVGRRAAIVGTRNATTAGLAMAYRLGRDLAEAGVHVVSGLARGVDGRAHRGALSSQGAGRPIGVVACGHDVIYPREHHELWGAVAEHGLLLSEHPPGTAPEAFRFPLRNRIIAALSEVVIAVESRERGGSLITTDEAITRNIPVMAVPGSPGNRAAAGVNRLLRDGAGLVLDVDDVLTVLSIHHQGASSLAAAVPADGVHRRVFQVCADEPRSAEGVALAVGIPLFEAATVLTQLESAGWLHQLDGWYEPSESAIR